jgi:hypothetical protein
MLPREVANEMPIQLILLVRTVCTPTFSAVRSAAAVPCTADVALPFELCGLGDEGTF